MTASHLMTAREETLEKFTEHEHNPAREALTASLRDNLARIDQALGKIRRAEGAV